MDTKTHILETALSLFSTLGYEATSIRDIGRIVGIKESSIYYHFTNKQAILEALKTRFIQISNGFTTYLDGSLGLMDKITRDDFRLISQKYVSSYYLDPFIRQFIRLMIIEQAANDELRDLYEAWCFEKPLDFQSRMFARLIQIGFIQPRNPVCLAIAYQAPIFYYFSHALLRDQGMEDRLLAEVDRQVMDFLDEYEVKA